MGNLFSNPSVSGASCQFRSRTGSRTQRWCYRSLFISTTPRWYERIQWSMKGTIICTNRLVPNTRWRPFCVSSQRELRHKSCWSWLILRELWRRFGPWGPFFRRSKKRDKVEASSCYPRVINKMGIYIVRLKFPTTQLGFQSEETSANPSLKPHKTLNIKPSWTCCNMKYSVSLGRIFQ